jgi:hypothetical protein
MMIAVVAVKIVWPCPSGRSCTDWRAKAKAMAPLSPVSANQILISESYLKRSKYIEHSITGTGVNLAPQ